jgi:hypothetical protein
MTGTDESVQPVMTSTDPSGSTDRYNLKQDSSNQQDSRTDTDTDRYRTDQRVCSLPVSQEEKPQTPNLISTDTDPAKPYVDRVVARFARYKNPGKDAEVFAKEILLSNAFVGSLQENWETYLPVHEATIGDLATRHLIDIIGWIFEINCFDNNPRAFVWAKVTHTMKNLRDHLLKDKSKLWEAYANWCCDFDGYKHGNRGSVAYALSTVGEPEFVEYANKVKARIARYKAFKEAHA